MADLLTVVSEWANENRERFAWDAEFCTWRRWTGQYWRAISPKSGEMVRAVAPALQKAGRSINGWETISSAEKCARVCMEREFAHAVPGLVSFVNGTVAPVEWMKDVSKPFIRPNDPGDNLTFGLPYSVAESAGETPATDRLLYGLLSDEPDRRLIYIHLGMALLRDITMRRSLWVQGPQMCGKSTLLYLANSVCGVSEPRKNAGPRIFRLSDEEADRQRQRNRERLLVTIDEMPPSLHDYEEGFKLLSSHGGVQYRAHHSMPDDGVWLPKLLIVSNNRPSFLDRAGAFESRLVYLSATGAGGIGARDPALLEAIQGELPALAWLALFHSASLLAQGATDYPLTERVRSEFRDVADDGNGIRQWVRERCALNGNDEGERVPINVLRDDYKRWAEQDSRKPVTAVVLRDQLKAMEDELGIRVYSTDRRYSVGGLRLRDWSGVEA
jgi:phage/plasmid-associated DNA primase